MNLESQTVVILLQAKNRFKHRLFCHISGGNDYGKM